MKKTLFFFLFLFLSYCVSANPLYFPTIYKIIVSGKYEYCYTRYDDLLLIEEVGSAGSIFTYDNGETFQEGYFVSDDNLLSKVGGFYYDLQGNYLGKVLISQEETLLGDIDVRTYVDAKNRPVATYKAVTGSLSSFAGLLSGNLGQAVGVSKVYILYGNVRMY